MNKKLMMGIVASFMAVVLAACGGNAETTSNSNADTANNSTENTEMNEDSQPTEESDSMEGMDHSGMNHSSSGEVPEDLAVAATPSYPVGSEAVINANHMGGMNGAVATITGAYNTTVYEVSYTPTNGGEPVENHKWVIHEEIENAGEEPFQPGDEVVLNANHMPGMDGATATIDSAKDTTVYMVSYTDKQTGEEVNNHKWVTESELSPVE